jgi:hypothetical protein
MAAVINETDEAPSSTRPMAAVINETDEALHDISMTGHGR